MIDTKLVKQLIVTQFPEYKELEIKPVSNMGHDNRTFHLGDELSVRLPCHENYASQILKEIRYLPFLSQHLSFPISTPVKVGEPDKNFPFHWSINTWLEGRTYKKGDDISIDLANVLKELQQIDASNGPISGKQNFYRGCSLSHYHEETLATFKKYSNPIYREIWELAINSPFTGKQTWIHGDVARGNILVKDNQFYALIDFGIMGVGDSACDLVIAWTDFNQEERKNFLQRLEVDSFMINRARGWALWKALITDDKVTLRVILEEYLNRN